MAAYIRGTYPVTYPDTLMWHAGNEARQSIALVLLVLLGVPALGFLVSVPVPHHESGVAVLVARIFAFGFLAVMLIAQLVRLGRLGAVRNVLRAEDIRTTLYAVIGGTVLILLGSTAAYVVLLGATIEELVFRSSVPRVLNVLLGKVVNPHYAYAGALLVAQLLFAMCHFFTPGHGAAFGTNLPLVRLFAAGSFLMIAYEVRGFPTAVLLHFVSNELIRTGLWGAFVAPTIGAVATCAAFGVVEMAALTVLRMTPGYQRSEVQVGYRLAWRYD